MTDHDITLTVDGTEHDLAVASRTLLIHALRDDLDYTVPTVGCESSRCGACTVRLDGDAVKACTVLAVQADGGAVETARGLTEDGDLGPIQEAFHREHGLQCGYCTPGMVTTVADLLERTPDPTDEEIRRGLKGNLCRCTGYENVVRAVRTGAEAVDAGGADDQRPDGGGER